MKKYFDEVMIFISDRFYCGLTLLSVVIAYGYAATNISIGIDDTRGQLETGTGRQFIASGRFSQVVLPALLGYHTERIENSYAIDVLAVFFLILAVTTCCVLFKKKSKDHFSMIALAIFAALTLTYPLANEIWEYTHGNLGRCISIFFVSIVIYLVDDCFFSERNKKQRNIQTMLGVFCLMVFICSNSESVVLVYILLVCAIVFISILFDSENWSMSKLIRTGIMYIVILISGIIGRVVIHKSILVLFDIPYEMNGGAGISWKLGEIGSQLYALVVNWFDKYLLKSIIYFPLTEMLVFGVVYICLLIYILKSSKRYIIVVPGIGMLISFIALSLVQGTVSPYRCVCSVFAFFMGFVGMLVCYAV